MNFFPSVMKNGDQPLVGRVSYSEGLNKYLDIKQLDSA
jgi:hypothetical protein